MPLSNEVNLLPLIPRVALDLLRQGRRGWIEAEGSMLSADVTGSTALTERLAERGQRGAEQITSLLTEVFGQLIEASTQYGGDVIEFAGDAILVLFSGPNHALAAAAAGTEMQRRLGTLESARSHDLSMRIGAHSGRFDLFLVGGQYQHLIVTGPAAAETIRLESDAKSNEVLVSPALAGLLPAGWVSRRLETGHSLDPRATADFEIDLLPAVEGDLASELVNPAIASHLALVRRLGGEHRTATVAFVGIDGISALLEQEGGDRLAVEIETVFDAALASASRYGANVLSVGVTHGGFKLSIVAGAPANRGGHEEAVIRAALDLLAFETRLHLTGGVTRGRVFAGFLGPETRHAYSTIGDIVNTAARLLGIAEIGQLVASSELANLPGLRLETEANEPRSLKGKTEPIVPHIVRSVGSSQVGAVDPRVDERLLIGRDRELDQLNELAHSLPTGALAIIRSEVGMGARRLLRAISSERAARFETRCERYDSLTPYASTRALLREMLDLDTEDQTDALRQRARLLPSELSDLLPLVGPILGINLPDTEASKLVAEKFRQASGFEVLVALIAYNLLGPTVLIVEDIQFADNPSRVLLEAIAGQTKDLPLVVLLSGAPESFPEPIGPDAVEINLGPIGDDAARRLALAVAEDQPVSDHSLDESIRRAGGNSLFLAELIRVSLTEAEFADSIDGVVTAMLDRLPPEDLETLRVASVLGAGFELEMLDDLLTAVDEPGSSSQLWDMPNLVEVGGGRAHFVRDLYREVCYQALSYDARQRVHLAAGRIMEQRLERSDTAVGLMSLHFHIGEDHRRAWDYSVAAGQAAVAAGAQVQAAESFDRALEAGRNLREIAPAERLLVTEHLGDARFSAGSFDDAATAFYAAFEWASDSEILRLMRKIGTARERSGSLAKATRWYERALGSIPDDADTPEMLHHRAQLRLAVCGLRHRQGRHADLREWAELALEDASRHNDIPSVALANERLLLATIYQPGDADLDAGQRALDLYKELGDEVARFRVLNNLGIVAHYAGDWNRAVEMYSAARDAARRAGDATSVGFGANNLGEVLCEQGHLEEAKAGFTEALRVWRASRYATGVAAASMNLGLMYARSSDIRNARVLLMSAMDKFEKMDAAYEANEARLRLVEALLIVRLVDQARRLLEEVETHEDLPTDQKMRVIRFKGSANLIDGELKDAKDHLTQAVSMAQAENADYELALAGMSLAICEDASGKSGTERRREAQAILDRLGVKQVTPLVTVS